jgi:hypothetical protein
MAHVRIVLLLCDEPAACECCNNAGRTRPSSMLPHGGCARSRELLRHARWCAALHCMLGLAGTVDAGAALTRVPAVCILRGTAFGRAFEAAAAASEGGSGRRTLPTASRASRCAAAPGGLRVVPRAANVCVCVCVCVSLLSPAWPASWCCSSADARCTGFLHSGAPACSSTLAHSNVFSVTECPDQSIVTHLPRGRHRTVIQNVRAASPLSERVCFASAAVVACVRAPLGVCAAVRWAKRLARAEHWGRRLLLFVSRHRG